MTSFVIDFLNKSFVQEIMYSMTGVERNRVACYPF